MKTFSSSSLKKVCLSIGHASILISLTFFITTYSFAGEVVGNATAMHSNRTQACADAKRRATEEMDLKYKLATADDRIFNRSEKQPLMQVGGCECSENMLGNKVDSYTCEAFWTIKYPQ